ncbi:DUF2314 domain-containing protein [Candidatus Halocynthiibacter alkanivorans]|jgi:uncharacterized protein YegJ (DUF2314 family)|uniref:DUF2314 domain-containing protein n=1 Tax=Candidatus Halocynthiibacter alkanivorans TaxID=2267619 RepID=UPI000DF3CB51|nr:DUF2314 domain-containing protein [Candidatus Halocynthiibacter alkanivorans]
MRQITTITAAVTAAFIGLTSPLSAEVNPASFNPEPLQQTSQGDPVQRFQSNDPEMAAAVAEACARLDRFFGAVLNEAGVSGKSAYVKVLFPVGLDGESEMIWVGPFIRYDDGGFGGLLLNNPNYMGALKAGDQVYFDQAMITDWSVTGKDGRQYGNYTARVMLSRLPEAEAAPVLAAFTENPLPKSWR